MRVEVVTIGTELLLGQIVDTNAAWLGEQLAASGFDAHYQQTVGDNRERIVLALRIALARSDAVIATGGLGPTQDDLTRDAIAEVMNVPLETDPECLHRIEMAFASRGRTMPPSNANQALVPSGATPIPQTLGTAPGLICPIGHKVLYALPGVPHELQEMFERAVLPDLRRRQAEAGEVGVIMSRVIRTWGMSESALAEALAPLVAELDAPGGNAQRATSRAADTEAAGSTQGEYREAREDVGAREDNAPGAGATPGADATRLANTTSGTGSMPRMDTTPRAHATPRARAVPDTGSSPGAARTPGVVERDEHDGASGAHETTAGTAAGERLTIAFLASGIEGIKVRLTAKAATAARATELLDAEEERVRRVLGEAVFGTGDESMERVVSRLLNDHAITIGLAESLTAGLVTSRLASIPGASRWLRGAIVSYDRKVKQRLLGLPDGPVVSADSARRMARGAREVLGADVGLSLTGVAGPDLEDGMPVGTVFVGIDVGERARAVLGEPASDAVELHLLGDRERVRQFAAISALDLIRRRALRAARVAPEMPDPR
jgi:PncC family amidohydrolase